MLHDGERPKGGLVLDDRLECRQRLILLGLFRLSLDLWHLNPSALKRMFARCRGHPRIPSTADKRIGRCSKLNGLGRPFARSSTRRGEPIVGIGIRVDIRSFMSQRGRRLTTSTSGAHRSRSRLGFASGRFEGGHRRFFERRFRDVSRRRERVLRDTEVDFMSDAVGGLGAGREMNMECDRTVIVDDRGVFVSR